MATTTQEAPDEAAPKQRRITVSGALLVLSGLAIVGTLLLWWLGTLPDEPETRSRPSRLRQHPGHPWSLSSTCRLPSSSASRSICSPSGPRAWERGSWENRSGMMKKRLHELREGLAMRTLMRDPNAGLMHSAIYYGFIVLFLGTVTSRSITCCPTTSSSSTAPSTRATRSCSTLFAVVFLVGIVWAAGRRYGMKPWRLRSKTKPEDAGILITLGLIGLTGLLVEAARIAEWAPRLREVVVRRLPAELPGPEARAAGIHQALWISHVVVFIVFLVICRPPSCATWSLAGEHVSLASRAAQGRHARDAQPDGGHRHRDGRGRDRRRVHLEAAVRHRRLHDLRPLHVGVPGQHHRQAARPARDRAQAR